MITYTEVTCDACGESQSTTPEQQQTGRTTPPGWLHGTLNVWDYQNKEGPVFGHICPACSELPLRALIEQFARYRAGLGARLA